MKARDDSGMTLLEVVLVIIIVGVLALLIAPNFVRARTETNSWPCSSNLRMIQAAKEFWAIEHPGGSDTIRSEQDLRPCLGRGSRGELPFCPLDKSQAFTNSYFVRPISVLPTCRMKPEGLHHNYRRVSGGGSPNRDPIPPGPRP